MKKEKEVPYSREQAEQVLKDRNRFYDVPVVLYESDKKFLNHKFPPKIEYVGKVWKTTNGIIFLCDNEADNGNLSGYGLLNSRSWFKGVVVNRNRYLTQATPTEWMAALEKFAERKYNVGDEVKCLSLSKPNEKIASFNHALNKLNCLDEWWATAEDGVALLMKDGIWTDIITPEKSDEESDFDKLRSEFNEMKKVLEDLKRKEKNKDKKQPQHSIHLKHLEKMIISWQNRPKPWENDSNKDELVSHLRDARGYCMNYPIFNFKK